MVFHYFMVIPGHISECPAHVKKLLLAYKNISPPKNFKFKLPLISFLYYAIYVCYFRLQRVVDVGICYPDIVLAFKLLKQTNLPAERRSLIIAALHSYLEEDRRRSLLQEAIG